MTCWNHWIVVECDTPKFGKVCKLLVSSYNDEWTTNSLAAVTELVYVLQSDCSSVGSSPTFGTTKD